MAIEDDEPKDREVWSNVARFWYNKAADNSPNIGRLYHHLAILARPFTMELLSQYTRSLTCVDKGPSRGRSLLKAKQGLIGFANGSSITAMADTGSRKNVISASYAKMLDLRIETLPSTFVIGNSRKIQSLGMYIYAYLSFFNGAFRLATAGFELTLNHLLFSRDCISSLDFCR